MSSLCEQISQPTPSSSTTEPSKETSKYSNLEISREHYNNQEKPHPKEGEKSFDDWEDFSTEPSFETTK